MEPQDKRMAAFVMEKMFKGTHFSICDVDTACKLMGCQYRGNTYEKLRTLHCVDWGDIPKDIMELVPVWINEVLGGPRLTVVSIPALREGNQELPQIEDYRAPQKLLDE